MNRAQYVVCLTLFFCSPVLAQNEAPRSEIFGGYSHNSYGAGFGLDIRINTVVSIRVLQADYIHTRFLEEGQHNGRLSFGIVLSFGGD